MKTKISILIIIFTLHSGFSYVQQNQGKINWLSGKVTITSTSKIHIKEGIPVDPYLGIPISLNAARRKSFNTARNLAMQSIISKISYIKIDPYHTLFDLIKKNDNLQKNIFHTINHNIKYKDYPKDFYTAECKAELKLMAIINILPYKYPQIPFPQFMDTPIKTPYTSLIIDTRGLQIKPMVFPIVLNQDGREFYNKSYVDIRYVHNQGIVQYATSDLQGKRLKIAGEHPYVTVAIKALNNCPVLSTYDMKRIFAHKETRNNLKKCKVIFIIDKI